MFSVSSVSIVVAILACFSGQGYARKCYVCTPDNPGCDTNPKQEKFIRNCEDLAANSFLNNNMPFNDNFPLNESLIRKMLNNANLECFKAVLSQGNERATIRGCGMNPITCEGPKLIQPMDVNIEYCKHCDTDLCNSASKIGYTIYSTAIALAILLFVWN